LLSPASTKDLAEKITSHQAVQSGGSLSSLKLAEMALSYNPARILPIGYFCLMLPFLSTAPIIF
jgi:hypothetical protein